MGKNDPWRKLKEEESLCKHVYKKNKKVLTNEHVSIETRKAFAKQRVLFYECER